jgi:molybdopterin-binding protein
MSQIVATIGKIESVESLNVVTFVSNGSRLTMVSLELGEKISVGRNVTLSCKPTSVALAKPEILKNERGEMLSYANQIAVTITSVTKGKLLSSVLLRFGDATLEALIITASLEQMGLKEGDAAIALIKVSDLSILEVLDD